MGDFCIFKICRMEEFPSKNVQGTKCSRDEMSGTKCPPFHYYTILFRIRFIFYIVSFGNDRASVPTDYSRGRVSVGRSTGAVNGDSPDSDHIPRRAARERKETRRLH